MRGEGVTALLYIIIALAITVTLSSRRIGWGQWQWFACQGAALGMFLLGKLA